MKSQGNVEKLELAISYVIRISVLAAGIGAALNREWEVVFVSALTLILIFVPSLVARNYKIHIPTEFEFLLLIFIYASVFLGEVGGYYTAFWWWDLLLHAISGVILGFIGFLTLNIMHGEKKIRAAPITIVFFSFCFAVALGTVWEIFEFVVDQISNSLYMQESLWDTMWDLIVDSAGAFLASLLGFLYLKRNSPSLFGKALNRWFEANKRWKRHLR